MPGTQQRPGDLTATQPAQICGLFSRKGTIAVGSDADLVIWDPRRERAIQQAELHHAVDYTLYEGMAVRGRSANRATSR
jgi:dihydropyrimidinase